MYITCIKLLCPALNSDVLVAAAKQWKNVIRRII